MDRQLKNLLSSHGVNLKKAYGQNFLTDQVLLEEIVVKAGVTKDDTVLEIGCGAGALTSMLARHAKKVVGYEIDKTLEPVLDQVLAGFSNTEIVFNDVMKEKLNNIEKKLGGPYILVANLPYYITTPIVMRFIENSSLLKGMVIMVQEEVADRFSAKAGDSEYGAITVGINLRGNARTIIRVPRDKFTPPPNVDSAVCKIDIDNEKFKGVDFAKVRNVVRCAFTSRRKMLVNNLMNGFKLSRAVVEKILTTSNLSLTCRGEQLSASDFVNLSQVLEDNGVKL